MTVPGAYRHAREVAATGWYLGHRAVAVGAACHTCETTPGASLLGQLRRTDGATPMQPQPRALENRYRAQLRRRMRDIHRLVLQAIKAELQGSVGTSIRERANRSDAARANRHEAAELAALIEWSELRHADDIALCADLVSLRLDRAVRRDSAASDARRLVRVIRRVQRAVQQTSPISQTSLHKLAEQVRRFTSRSVTNQVQSVLAIDVLPTLGQASHLLTAWARDNASLIQSLSSRYFDEIAEAVQSSVIEGHSTRSLTKAIQHRYNVSRSRADLIAVDQVGTLNAQITQERQTQLGIEEYIWSSNEDIHVRPLHVQLNNQRRRWDDPHPTEGHPGMPIRCRCSALPVFD